MAAPLRTKAEMRSLVQQLADDPDGRRWSADNLDLLMGAVYDEKWCELLQFAPLLLSQMDTLTSLTSPGYLTFTQAGDLDERPFRIQDIIRNARHYISADPHDIVIEDGARVTGPHYRYWLWGTKLYLFPLDTTTDVEIRYSYLPTEYDALADNVVPEWPDGHELALYYACAVRAMSKGNVEEVRQMRSLEKESWNTLVSHVRRLYPGPDVMRAAGQSRDWGGVD